jgi:hypothetical protein
MCTVLRATEHSVTDDKGNRYRMRPAPKQGARAR